MDPRTLKILALSALAAGVLVVGVVAFRMGTAEPAFLGTAFPPEAAPPIALVDHDGKAVTLDDYRGQAVLLFFGFTRCPDVCPLTLSRLGGVLGSMGDDAEDVRVLLVTVDPAADSAHVLKGYLAHYGPRFTGLTGDSAALAAVYRGYGAYVSPGRGAAHGGMAHSSAVYGIDRKGRLRVVIPETANTQEVRADVRTLADL
jgi:protein SCO1/2